MGKGWAAAAGFDPSEWSVVGYFYNGGSDDMHDAYRDDIKELRDRIGEDRLTEVLRINQCESCGTRFNHGALVADLGGDELVVGGICATEYFSLPNITALKQKEAAAIKKRREWAEAAAKKKAATLADNPGLEEALKTDHYIITDIGAKLEKWGDLSERQIALIFKIAKEEAERAAIAATEATEIKTPVVEGTDKITGTVLSTKYQDGYYGTTYKMLVKVETPAGVYKLWGTVPRALDENPGPKGRKVEFIADVETSKDDEFFGFYKRPRQARFLD